METKFQNTFIPKSALDTPSITPNRQANFLTFVSMIIFLLSCVLAGGVFLWGQYLAGQVSSLNQSLEINKNAFEPGTIEQYSRLNSRFDSARGLLSSHVAASAFFDLLNKDTLKTIQFSDLKYSQDGSGLISIKMSGKAKSYNSVAYQAKIFSNEVAFKNAVFSNLDLDQSGNVIFEFDTQVNPSLVTYQNNIAAYKNLSNNVPQTLSIPDQNSVSSSSSVGGLSFPPVTSTSSNVKSIKK